MGGTGPTPTAGGVPPVAEQLETGQRSGTVGGRRPRVAPSPDPGPGSEPDISPPESCNSLGFYPAVRAFGSCMLEASIS